MSKEENQKGRVEEETERTLGVLDTLENIDVGPYFFERLKANFTSPGEPLAAGILSHVLGGRLTPALLAIVLVANILTAAMVLRTDRRSQSALRNQNVEALADEYLLTGTMAAPDNGTE
ncbi:MAG TPA: hypothetical protein VMS71_00090 [Candidatus Acidoferrum sp.]|nr:hypothetical protein [Candidatus Acidoferrum sp.]